MLNIADQAQEAASRSVSLAAANTAIDQSRGETLHPSVAKALETAPDKKKPESDKAADKSGERQKDPKSGPDDDVEKSRRMDMMQSPSRGIASMLRVPKSTGMVREDPHSGDIDVWHLVGHLSKTAANLSRYGMAGVKSGIEQPKPVEKAQTGFLDGLKSGYQAGQPKTAAEVREAAIAKLTETGAQKKAQPTHRRRAEGMEL